MVKVDISTDPIEDVYELGDELGRGKFGVVKKCVCKATKEEYAAKFIRKRKTRVGRGQKPEDIHREIEIMQALNGHPRIVTLEAVFEDKVNIIMVMELLRGTELFAVLAKKDHFMEGEAIDYIKQMLNGIAYIHHKGYIHLDLKPENVVLQDEDSCNLKIIDFGLAQKYNPGASPKEIVGTPEFMAPESISFDPTSPATDMWAVGVITYILISGCSPFLGDDDCETYGNITSGEVEFPEEYFAGISPEVQDFICNLVAQKPADRLTAESCLVHQWLAPKKRKNLKRIGTKRLRRFNAQRKWQEAIQAVLRTLMMARVVGFMREMVEEREKNSHLPIQPTDKPASFKRARSTIKLRDRSSLKSLKKKQLLSMDTISAETAALSEPRTPHDDDVETDLVKGVVNVEMVTTPRQMGKSQSSTEFSRKKTMRLNRGQVRFRRAGHSLDQTMATSLAVPAGGGNTGGKEESTALQEVTENVVFSVPVLAATRSAEAEKPAPITEEVKKTEVPETTTTTKATEDTGKSSPTTSPALGGGTRDQQLSLKQAPVEEIITRTSEFQEAYEIGDELHRGRFGVIHRCRSKKSGADFALKLIRKRFGRTGQGRQAEHIYNELDIMKLLANHPHIVTLVAVYDETMSVIAVMELLRGSELFTTLATNEHFTETEAINYLKQLLSGVEFIHEKGIMHLNLQPENIILQNEFTKSIKIIDFSNAQKYDPDAMSSEIVGNPEYTAPETIAFESPTPAVDMWSLGILTYILLSGLSPFVGVDERQTYENITTEEVTFPDEPFIFLSPRVKDFIRRMLDRDPRDRLTAADSFNHPWINSLRDSRNRVQTVRLKRFNATRLRVAHEDMSGGIRLVQSTENVHLRCPLDSSLSVSLHRADSAPMSAVSNVMIERRCSGASAPTADQVAPSVRKATSDMTIQSVQNGNVAASTDTRRGKIGKVFSGLRNKKEKERGR